MGAGAAWKQRREEMGKTLEDVSLELRISQKYLRGMEEGDYARFPAKVFATGFIRAYAAFLSTSPEPLLTEYFAVLATKAEEEAPLPTRPEWLERERRQGTRRTAYAAATGVVLLIGVLLAWYSRYSAPRAPAASAVSEESSPPAVAAPAEATPVAPAPTALATPARHGTATEGGAGRSSVSAEPATVPASGGSAQVSAPYQLFLEASELTWIMYSRDGADPVDVMLYPGDRLSIQAKDKMYVKIGNAGGVIGTLNGVSLPSFGKTGEVKELTLGE